VSHEHTQYPSHVTVLLYINVNTYPLF